MRRNVCLVKNCNELAKSHELCSTHYQRYAKHGSVKDPTTSPVERFMSRVTVGDGCWLWTGHADKGYGRLGVDGKGMWAHRFAYQLAYGDLDPDLTIDHLCKETLCVRPSHLEQVTLAVNSLRGDGPAGLNIRKTHCIRGHEFTPENTRLVQVRPNGRIGRNCRMCERLRQPGRTLRRREEYSANKLEWNERRRAKYERNKDVANAKRRDQYAKRATP